MADLRGAGYLMRPGMENRSTREETERAAAAWILRRANPHWSDTDQAALDRWLAAAPGHRVSYVRLEAIWDETDRLKSIASGFAKEGVPPRGAIELSPFFTMRREEEDPSTGTASPIRHSPRYRRNVWGAAASLLLVFAGLAYFVRAALEGATYSTSIGGMATIPMEDGSVVTLNTNSQIEVRFSANERRIELKKGEAFFDVADEPAKPFVVHARGQRVVALGTKFSVRMEPDTVRVAVTEGKVSFQRADWPFWSVSRKTGIPRVLSPGGVAMIAKSRARVDQEPMPKLEQALSWRSGYIELDGTPLAEAVAEFNRYNIRHLVIGDPALATRKIEGNLRSNNLDGFVRLLEQGFGISAVPEADDRIVLRKR